MRSFRILAAVAVVVVGVTASTINVRADDKAIKEIMEHGFKGENAPVNTVGKGTADEATLKKFFGYYETMAATKPPVGDEAAWKKKVAALVEATKAIQEKKPGAADAFKAAANCKSCHTDHKPKKK